MNFRKSHYEPPFFGGVAISSFILNPACIFRLLSRLAPSNHPKLRIALCSIK